MESDGSRFWREQCVRFDDTHGGRCRRPGNGSFVATKAEAVCSRFAAAQKLAAEKKLPILIDFTGSTGAAGV